MRARFSLVAAAAVVAVVVAGCGGSGGGAGAGNVGGGAAVVPADAVAFVAVDSNLSSGQWQAVDGLLKKLPDRDTLLTKLRTSFEKSSKVSWSQDVEPALGDELDLAVLPGGGDKPQLVALTQPSDQAKLDALLHKLDSGGSAVVSAQVDGWTVLAETQAALDAVKGATSHLADVNTYQDAVAKLDGSALARVYANGTEALQVASSLGQGVLGSSGLTLPATSTLQWLSADVVASGDGLQVRGYTRSDQASGEPEPYASTLVDRIPAGALLVADVQASSMTGTDSTGAALPQQLQDLLSGLHTALGGETAVYVTPGLPLPSLTLATHPSDPQAAAAAIDKLVPQLLAGLGSATGSSSSGSGLDLGSLLGNLKPVHTVVDGTLVVSTSPTELAAFGGSGTRLADDGTFKEATSASAMPDKTTGFVYVNLKDALPLLESFVALGGATLPSGLEGDLAPLRTFTAYGGRDGDLSSFTAFLEVR